MKKKRGFTLLELMIVVIVIAILAAIAVPSYTEQVHKSRRAQAKADLAELAQVMERNFTMTRDYTKDSTGAAFALPFTQSPRNASAGKGYYDLTVAPLATTSYILVATPKNVQSPDRCGDFSLNSLGQKTFSTGTTDYCGW